MGDTEHLVTQMMMKKMYWAHREVHQLGYHSSRKKLKELTTAVANRLGVTEVEATQQMLDKFGGNK